MSRKKRLLRNMGGTFREEDHRTEQFFDGPQQTEIRTSIVLPERVIRAVLVSEIERLAEDKLETERFFSHFFDPTVASIAERDSWVSKFRNEPPKVVMGYPRDLADMPIFSIILANDNETEPAALARYVGSTLDGENPPGGEDAEYEGGYFEQTNTVYIYATHPDVTLFLYQFAKMTLFGARSAMEAAGLIDIRYSGGEVAPEEMPYLPDNVFVRALSVTYSTMMTVPRLYGYRDGRKVTITGIFHEDVVMEGMRGGVKPYAESDDGE